MVTSAVLRGVTRTLGSSAKCVRIRKDQFTLAILVAREGRARIPSSTIGVNIAPRLCLELSSCGIALESIDGIHIQQTTNNSADHQTRYKPFSIGLLQRSADTIVGLTNQRDSFLFVGY